MHVGLANARLPFVGQGFIRAGDGLFGGFTRRSFWRVYPTRQNGDAGQAIFLAGLPDDLFGGPSISL
jgi:hypothetical protein